MKRVLLVVVGALIALEGTGSARPGDDEETRFTLLARDQIVIGAGSKVTGGAVGVAGIDNEQRGNGRGFAVEITGAKVKGDVYGQSVLLEGRTKVGQVFTDRLRAGMRVKHGYVSGFPHNLPRIAPAPRVDFVDTFEPPPVFVPTGTRAVLAPNSEASAVTVESGATLVVTGGVYAFVSLDIKSGGRLEVLGPSLLMVDLIADFGSKAYVGPPEGAEQLLNLTLVVGGYDLAGSSDGFEGGAVVMGERARISAIVRVNGTISMHSGSLVRGPVYGHRILLDNAAVNRLITSEEPPEVSPQCSILGCIGPNDCIPVKLPPGTPCNDGNACTGGDACDDNGQCLSGSAVPDPDPSNSIACIRDDCDPAFGIYEPAGTVCNQIQCQTATTCDGQGGCTVFGAPLPQGTMCDDGIPNNGPDTCFPGAGCYGLLGPFDCKANNCSAQPGDPPDLACWFASHPAIRDAISWSDLDSQNPTVTPYSQWSSSQKQQLKDAFDAAWQWFDSGLTNFPGTPIPEPPPNDLVQVVSDPSGTMFMDATAFPLYLAHVAHSLAVEIRGEVKWSLCDYSPQFMTAILSGSHFQAHYRSGFVPGHFPVGNVTPAHPTFIFPFLVDNALISPSRLDTIGNVIDWSRRLRHFVNAWSGQNALDTFQYPGFAPVSRTIDGTFNINFPINPFGHWTVGCSGTTGFLQAVLRAVNIPVHNQGVCGHKVPHFLSEGKWLSHGDDPYTAYFHEGPDTTVFPPGVDFLIDETQYMAWFTGAASSCTNVGRRSADLAVDLVPDYLVNLHCKDLKQNKSHADSKVYEALDFYYTVQELEAATLWSRLDQRVSDLNLSCNGP